MLSVGCKSGVTREPFMQFNSGMHMLRIAEEWHGIVTLAQENGLLESTSLVPLLSDVKGPKIDMFFIFPEHLKELKRVEALWNFLKKKIA